MEYKIDPEAALPIKNVALLSPTGNLGPFILQALEAEGFAVTAIVRNSSKSHVPAHIKTIRVGNDYPREEMVAAFKGHDAVALSLSILAADSVALLLDSIVEAGVRRCIGSFFGGNIEDRKQDIFPLNRLQFMQLERMRYLQNENPSWSWTAIVSGVFTDLAAQMEMFRIHPSKLSAELLDGGDHAFTSTTRKQVGLAVARVLRKPHETANSVVYVASFEKSLLEYLEAYKKVTGKQEWNVTTISGEQIREESEKRFANGDMIGLAGLAFVTSAGADYDNRFSRAGRLSNKLLELPEESLEEVLQKAIEDGPPVHMKP